jgi:hypothetical protein
VKAALPFAEWLDCLRMRLKKVWEISEAVAESLSRAGFRGLLGAWWASEG